MDDAEQLKDILRELFSSQKLAVLSTHDRGQAYASLMSFATTPDLKELLFATLHSTRKFSNLTANPHAAMLIDNRSNQDADIHHAVAVTAVGKAEEINEAEHDRYLRMYITRLPHLERFVTSPTCILMRLKVECYYIVRRFQEVMELHVGE